jgi:sortase A
VLVDAALYQAFQSRRFLRTAPNSGASIGTAEIHTSPVLRSKVKTLHAGVEGSPLGRIDIPRVGLSAMILEGTGHRTLRRGAGHVPGTPLPGQEGNVAIAGHRDTFFRTLRDIHTGDEITLTTLDGSYSYRVSSARVVDPGDTAVLDDSEDSVLTLVTCYPFYFVGPAPKRFVVRAEWIAR